MIRSDTNGMVTLDQLRAWLHAVEPGALLVEPRILRRVIRLDRRLEGLTFGVPHWKTYTIERERLLAYAEPTELGLPSPEDPTFSQAAELPRTVILLTTPTEEETFEGARSRETWRTYWRLLFHARIHIALSRRLADHNTCELWARNRREAIGAVEFAEIRQVLTKDEYLFPEATDLETYVEFVAVYLELKYFAEPDLTVYFPSIRDWERVDTMVSQDVDHESLHASCRPEDLFVESTLSEEPTTEATTAAPSLRGSGLWGGKFAQRQTRARRASALGNSVKAAILQVRSGQPHITGRSAETRSPAIRELRQMVLRLAPVLELSESDIDNWCSSLEPLLAPAAVGFWSLEAKLLYDLQKVCVEFERGVFTLDVIEWIRTFGQRPIRRPLPLLREVLIAKHLRSAARRLATAHLEKGPRQRLHELLHVAVKRSEQRSREQIRPVMKRAFDAVGLTPSNVAERVAQQNVIEELLDRIVEHGAVNLGNLRDALSKFDLKLPDLGGVDELFRGDRLLRADRLLGTEVEGVYRPGAVYLRWTQRLSSLAFGTRIGRWITQYFALPFGGAYLALAGLHHLFSAISGSELSHSTSFTQPIEPISETWNARSRGVFFSLVILMGIWITLLIHRPRFRAWCIEQLRFLWTVLREVVVDLPAGVLRSPLVQRVLRSPAYAAIRAYVVRPLLITVLCGMLFRSLRRPLDMRGYFEIFLLVGLFLNSPAGRYVDEWTGDFLVRAWHNLRIRVFAAAFQWIMEAFHGLVVGLERLVYGVDEWLRFRAGDNRFMQAVKALAGICWFFVSYFVVFVFTLLLEPQINPIKHFPVVTVSHKLILPAYKVFVEELEPYLGQTRAIWIVWSTIWLIPGVFGFLVWELRGNWQLYAANRPNELTPLPLGHHGETMVGLLRPGVHSGTLPKLFAGLRRSLRKALQSGNWRQAQGKKLALHRVEECVRRFVEREFIGVLEATRFPQANMLAVEEVHVSTSRIEVSVRRRDQTEPARLVWEENDGQLSASVERIPWSDAVTAESLDSLRVALAGLFQKSGAQSIQSSLALPTPPALTWSGWITALSKRTC